MKRIILMLTGDKKGQYCIQGQYYYTVLWRGKWIQVFFLDISITFLYVSSSDLLLIISDYMKFDIFYLISSRKKHLN